MRVLTFISEAEYKQVLNCDKYVRDLGVYIPSSCDLSRSFPVCLCEGSTYFFYVAPLHSTAELSRVKPFASYNGLSNSNILKCVTTLKGRHRHLVPVELEVPDTIVGCVTISGDWTIVRFPFLMKEWIVAAMSKKGFIYTNPNISSTLLSEEFGRLFYN